MLGLVYGKFSFLFAVTGKGDFSYPGVSQWLEGERMNGRTEK